MISSWATKRKMIYAFGTLLCVGLIVYGAFFKFVYVAPSCTDGNQNGTETGVDCGGVCTTVCTSDALTPIVYWSKVFNVSGGVYSLSAYVENPNINTENIRATYEFKVFDTQNKLIDTRTGETFIPKNKKFVVFEPGFVSKTATPKRVEFSFTSFGVWKKDTSDAPKISVSHSALLSTSTMPRIEGTVTNNGTEGNGGLELVALIGDSKENTIAVSRTFVDALSPHASGDFVFTWPKPFSLGVEECSTPLDIALTLDKSGSMRSDNQNPPEPFTTVKAAGRSFVQTLSSEDGVAIVSFGDNADLTSSLSSDKQKAIGALDFLSLGTTSEQTNLAAGFMTAFTELTAHLSSNKSVIIVLTDGSPTEPKKSGEADYPKSYAQKIAQDIADAHISVFTIGLGRAVDSTYLKSLVSNGGQYYFAPTKDTLNSIYTNISSSLCVKKPSSVTIIYRVLK